MNCDCLNDCGDDDRLKTGKVQPCEHMAKRLERQRLISEQVATITHLRQIYGADNIFELIEKMHAEIVRLDAVQRSLFAQREGLRSIGQEPHPPTRHCMCNECKPSFEDDPALGPDGIQGGAA